MADDSQTSHDMSTTLPPGGAFGPSSAALQQMLQQQQAYSQAYNQKLQANRDWLARQQQPHSRMRYVHEPNTPEGGLYAKHTWMTDDNIPYGAAPDAPQTPMPYPELGYPSALPHFQDGGYTPGGSVVVGEDGPEVADLPQGTYVHPNSGSLRNAAQFTSTLYPPMPGSSGVRSWGGVPAAVAPYGQRPNTYNQPSPYAPDMNAYVGVYGPNTTTPPPYPMTPGAAPVPASGMPVAGNGGAMPGQGMYGDPNALAYYPWEMMNALVNQGIALSGLTGTMQSVGPDGQLTGDPRLTFPATNQLAGLLGYMPGSGIPTLAGNIAENTRQQQVANFMGNTFGGTGSSYRPGVDNRLPSRDFHTFINNTTSNPVDAAAWEGFVKYMESNLTASDTGRTRFNIIMRGEQVGNPTKGEQALMAGVMQRRGMPTPTLTPDSGV